jgi:ParB family chromosome partitioning protein
LALSILYDVAVVEEISTRLIRAASNPLRSSNIALEELAMSIRQHGLLQPILVRPRGEFFEIVAGNRRFAAFKSLKIPKIPCVVREMGDKEAFELAITENVERKSLNPIEEAIAFRTYTSQAGWGSVTELAYKLGKSPAFITQRISLLKLPEDVQEKIASGEICPSTAREIVSQAEPKLNLLVSLALNNKMSSRKIKEFARSSGTDSWPPSPRKEGTDGDLKILKKSTLILRVAMLRISGLVENADDESIKEYLFSEKRSLHDMIDRTIRLSMKRKSSAYKRYLL